MNAIKPRPLHAIIIALLFLASAADTLAAPRGGASGSGDRQVTKVIDAFVAAWNAHDIATLTALFTANGSFKSPAGHGARTRPGIHDLLAQEHRDIFVQSTLAETITKIDHPKAGVAVAKGTFTLTNIPVIFGIDVAREGTFDFHVRRTKGRWLISSARITKS